MRKAEIFFDAITNIKEALIDDALDYRFTKRHIPWQRYMSMAACLALVATVVSKAHHSTRNKKHSSECFFV